MLKLATYKSKTVRTGDDEYVYAIGDVHGRLDLLVSLLERIDSDSKITGASERKRRIIFLGDIIDRGPESLACLRVVQTLCLHGKAELIKGNHEDLLLRSMQGDVMAQEVWLAHGGQDTLKTLGLTGPEENEDSFDFADRLRQSVPDDIVEFLNQAPTSLSSGDYFFCHAGVRPGRSLERQTDHDLFFIRDDFTNSRRWHGKVVVHGHTISETVEIKHNRIGVDTGAHKTHRLSCIRLIGKHQTVIQVEGIPESKNVR